MTLKECVLPGITFLAAAGLVLFIESRITETSGEIRALESAVFAMVAAGYIIHEFPKARRAMFEDKDFHLEFRPILMLILVVTWSLAVLVVAQRLLPLPFPAAPPPV